jgi:hypothetical protein
LPAGHVIYMGKKRNNFGGEIYWKTEMKREEYY